jgi:hypothetical protein
MASTEHPLSLGARVYHMSQQWHRPDMGGTAQVVEVYGPLRDGSYEYTVLTGIEFSRQVGPHNPMIRETKWSSDVTRKA